MWTAVRENKILWNSSVNATRFGLIDHQQGIKYNLTHEYVFIEMSRNLRDLRHFYKKKIVKFCEISQISKYFLAHVLMFHITYFIAWPRPVRPKHVALTDEFNKSLLCLTTTHIPQHNGTKSIKIVFTATEGGGVYPLKHSELRQPHDYEVKSKRNEEKKRA